MTEPLTAAEIEAIRFGLDGCRPDEHIIRARRLLATIDAMMLDLAKMTRERDDLQIIDDNNLDIVNAKDARIAELEAALGLLRAECGEQTFRAEDAEARIASLERVVEAARSVVKWPRESAALKRAVAEYNALSALPTPTESGRDEKEQTNG